MSNMNDDFLKKLMVSKAIMEKHNAMPRNTNGQISESSLSVQTFDETPIPATYNLPDEYMTSTQTVKTPPMVTEDRIKNSKLPDAIKKLMLEHPIVQPQQAPTTSVLSDEMIERASKLMNNGKNVVESKKTTSSVQSNPDLKRMIKESVKEILSEYGVIPESSEEVNEVMVIKVGKHIFEGKISKIKKVK